MSKKKGLDLKDRWVFCEFKQRKHGGQDDSKINECTVSLRILPLRERTKMAA